jgi:hypothetical protein
MPLTESAVTSTIVFGLTTGGVTRDSSNVTSEINFGLEVFSIASGGIGSGGGGGGGASIQAIPNYAGYATLRRVGGSSLLVHFIKADAFISTTKERRSGSLVVLGRSLPVALWDVPAGRSGTFGIATENSNQAQSVRNLFSTGSPMQMISCPLTDLVGMWFMPKAFNETKMPYSIFSPYRVFQVDFEQCGSPV